MPAGGGSADFADIPPGMLQCTIEKGSFAGTLGNKVWTLEWLQALRFPDLNSTNAVLLP